MITTNKKKTNVTYKIVLEKDKQEKGRRGKGEGRREQVKTGSMFWGRLGLEVENYDRRESMSDRIEKFEKEREIERKRRRAKAGIQERGRWRCGIESERKRERKIAARE